MATGQHRCVFVGNIPYDATEEQLVEICQEVGPVVSFRLVIDRETGKPKGYGFCEYKDEETALSARRNLQGYEINGRQLRVDFAENDKASDRSREQARGGPGIATSTDLSKQVGPALVVGDPTHHQPIGLQIAMTAATVMAGVLGGAQAGNQSQLALANDPLTLHLAKLSRNQLYEIISDVKAMATQNKESVRQLLVGMPQLSKALFQAQIMLGMVTPEVLQNPNLVQTSGHASQIPSHSALLPNVKEGQVSTMPQNPVARTQISAPIQIPIQSRVHPPLHPNNNHTLQQNTLRPNSLVSPFPTIQPQPHSSNSLSIRPQIPLPNTSLNQQIPPSSLNGLAYNSQMVRSNVPVQPTRIPIPLMSDARYQPGPSIAPTESVYHPSKRVKHDVGSLPVSNMHNANGLTQPQVTSQTPVSQTQLPTGVEPALLQQVLSLTPEQLSLLSPQQKQEVTQLQEMLRANSAIIAMRES